MSHENGAQDPDFNLSRMVEDVSQHSFAQTEALKDKQKTLLSLQAMLSEVETKCKQAEMELCSKVRMLLASENEMEHVEKQTQVLLDHCMAISVCNAELQRQVIEEQEKATFALVEYNSYRAKMEEHRAAILFAFSHTKAHEELEERRAQVRRLQQEKEELKRDLQNPNGNSVQMAKKETIDLKAQIIVKKKAIEEKRNKLGKETEMHMQMKKDIEIQNRRYEAILKRLHCQLSKAQAVHRQMSADIHHMERQISELKRQLETSQARA